MNDDNKQNQEPSEEELEELKEVIKKLEKLQEEQQKDPKKRPRKPFIAIEFGGVFHHNPIVNFVFGLIVNMFFMYLLIEFFQFAQYNDILYLIALVVIYSIAEELFRNYLMMRHFALIMRSFGTIYYFGYLIIFFVLDQYIFIDSFNFLHETMIVFFVLIFTLLRYGFGTTLRRYFRRRNMR